MNVDLSIFITYTKINFNLERGLRMKGIYHIVIFLGIMFSLFFGTGFFLLAVNGDEVRLGGDRVYNAISDGFTFLITLLCVISSITFIFLYKILEQLKKLNSNK